MALPSELQSIIKQKGDIVTTAQANEVGISNERLRLRSPVSGNTSAVGEVAFERI